jgi:hypothetical protein
MKSLNDTSIKEGLYQYYLKTNSEIKKISQYFKQ